MGSPDTSYLLPLTSPDGLPSPSVQLNELKVQTAVRFSTSPNLRLSLFLSLKIIIDLYSADFDNSLHISDVEQGPTQSETANNGRTFCPKKYKKLENSRDSLMSDQRVSQMRIPKSCPFLTHRPPS